MDRWLSNSGDRSPGNDVDWLPVSDLMSGLTMVFMLIAIALMYEADTRAKASEAELNRVELVAETYAKARSNLRDALVKELGPHLERWKASIDDAHLTVRFEDPEVMFRTGASDLQPQFKRNLAEFFPLYVAILSRDEFRGHVEEVRIEGHTSSMWRYDTDFEEAYLLNMALSQARTRETLAECLRLAGDDHRDWLRAHLTANGLSSSRLIRHASSGIEDALRSQRVEFRVVTDAEVQINEILRQVQEKSK